MKSNSIRLNLWRVRDVLLISGLSPDSMTPNPSFMLCKLRLIFQTIRQPGA